MRHGRPEMRVPIRISSGRWGMGKLEGKVALVTGSGRNIGRATVLKLAGEGAHVVVNARSNQQEAESVVREARDLGVRAVSVLADVGKKAEVEALADKALSEVGRVDILINNAAIRPHKPFTETSDADWELIRSVVLDGPLYLTRALIELMVRDRYGRILFFVGDGSISARGSGRTHLSAAKMGLIGMARGLASEFAPLNIRVNVVSPGSIDTRPDNPEWYQGHLPRAAAHYPARASTPLESSNTLATAFWPNFRALWTPYVALRRFSAGCTARIDCE